MAVVLIIGSHVASSRVGGSLANLALALSPFQIEPMHVPTTLLGRHPGWGAPGGGAVPDNMFAGMLEGIAANGLFASIDGVVTNYFASVAQIEFAARAIDAVKAANPACIAVVDPVMGDAPGGLYVPQAIGEALAIHLLPRADYLTPNLWELGYLTRLPTDTMRQIRYAARTFGKPTVVTSVPYGDEIGAMLVDATDTFVCSHGKSVSAPKGTGDLFSALFLGHLLNSQIPRAAFAKALAGVSVLVDASVAWATSDLPIVGQAHVAWRAEALDLEHLP
jgi:pyridoxine kinase